MVNPAKGAKIRPAYAITSVDHALRLAAQLQLEGRLTVTEAAARLGVAASTAHRLLTMLVYRDFAIKDGRSYRMGPVLCVGPMAQNTNALLREVSLPAMRELVAAVDETATLVTRSGRSSRFICEVESSQMLRVGNRSGMVFPAYRTSGGLALLAELSDGEIRALYDPERLGPDEEAPDIEAVLRRVDAIRSQGFCLSHGLAERGVLGIGHVVKDSKRQAVAALSVAMPSARFQPPMLRPFVAALRQAVRDTEARLAEKQAPAGEATHA